MKRTWQVGCLTVVMVKNGNTYAFLQSRMMAQHSGQLNIVLKRLKEWSWQRRMFLQANIVRDPHHQPVVFLNLTILKLWMHYLRISLTKYVPGIWDLLKMKVTSQQVYVRPKAEMVISISSMYSMHS